MSAWVCSDGRRDSYERYCVPDSKTDGKGKSEGKSDKKPLPPCGLWVSRFDAPPDVDCGDALNE